MYVTSALATANNGTQLCSRFGICAKVTESLPYPCLLPLSLRSMLIRLISLSHTFLPSFLPSFPRSYNDPDAWDWAITRAYVKITKPFNELAYGKYGVYFDFFIIAVIVMAGAQVGIQTYPYYECAAPQAQGSDYWDQMEGETVGQNDKDYREFCKEFGDPWLGGDGYIDVAIFWIFVAEVRQSGLLSRS